MSPQHSIDRLIVADGLARVVWRRAESRVQMRQQIILQQRMDGGGHIVGPPGEHISHHGGLHEALEPFTSVELLLLLILLGHLAGEVGAVDGNE